MGTWLVRRWAHWKRWRDGDLAGAAVGALEKVEGWGSESEASWGAWWGRGRTEAVGASAWQMRNRLFTAPSRFGYSSDP